MSLTIQQLLNDAKRLSGRLREHDASADNVISTTQSVLKDIEAMRQYQEDIDSLNSIAHNRPRAQLVLGNILLNLKTEISEMTFGNLLEAYISLFISSDFSPTKLCKLYSLKCAFNRMSVYTDMFILISNYHGGSKLWFCRSHKSDKIWRKSCHSFYIISIT